MTNIATIVTQLRKERDLAARSVERLDAALSALNGSRVRPIQTGRKLSPAARARIAAAQRARWAKVHKKKNEVKQNVVAMPKKRMSASARKKIAQAQKARWAKLKSHKKSA
jgi:hypothetical protein